MSGLAGTDLRNYGVLALPVAIAGLPLYLHAPDFYATERGVNLAQLGLALMAVRILDAVQDPLIGVLSDRFRSIRKQLMLWASVGLAVGMGMLFMPPAEATVGWFLLWITVATSCYSVITINLNTLGGLWSSDRHERTRIASARERFGLIGVSLGVIVPGILVYLTSKQTAFMALAAGIAVLLGFGVWRFSGWYSRAGLADEDHSRDGDEQWSFSIKGRTPVVRLIMVTFAGALGSALPAVLFLFFIRDRLMAEQWTWLFLLLYFAAALAGIPFWRDLSKRLGKVRAWILSIGLAILSFAVALFAGNGDILLFAGVCLVTGFALGGDLVFPFAIMADLVGDSTRSRRHASSGYSWLSFVQKAALGLTAGIAFFLLDRFGFVTGSDNPEIAITLLLLLYAGLPLVLKTCSLCLLWVWQDKFADNQIYEKETNPNLCRPAGAVPNSDWMQ